MTIRDIRHQYGLTQQAMSDLLNIPRRTIQEWEAGRRTPPEWVPPLIEHELERKKKEDLI